MTFAAVEGLSTSCVKLLGITTFRVDQTGKPLASSQPPCGEQKLFLVFERASQGNLLDFLDRHLEGLGTMESWLATVIAIECVANGLSGLHKRGVIHG
jgi:hypothetical protein